MDAVKIPCIKNCLMDNVRNKLFFNWSGGKDSSLALYHLLKGRNYSVEKLLTNISGDYHRVSMHGVREELLQQQAEAIGIHEPRRS